MKANSILCLALFAAGCSRQDSHEAGEHGHAHHAEAESMGADFDPEQGLALSDEAAGMIGIETAPAVRRELALEFTAPARVFHAAHQHAEMFPGHKDGHAYANVMVPASRAGNIRTNQPVELTLPGTGETVQGRIARVERSAARAIGQLEIVVEIPDPEERFPLGGFFEARLKGAERDALVIPRTALVEAATGSFAYVQNGDRYKRTPLKTGGITSDYVEVLEGLDEGDQVVTQGARGLWLTELRFTKGGGHAH